MESPPSLSSRLQFWTPKGKTALRSVARMAFFCSQDQGPEEQTLDLKALPLPTHRQQYPCGAWAGDICPENYNKVGKPDAFLSLSP